MPGSRRCRRIKANTVEKRLLNSRGEPNFNVNFYVINKRGEYAGVALYAQSGKSPVQYALCAENGPRTATVEPLFPGSPND